MIHYWQMLQRQPVISLIICAAPNKKKDLWRCLRSIIGSTLTNWEVVVVDNTGAFGLQEAIREKFKNQRIRVVKMHKNSGLLGMNIGLANARGKYLMTLDDDCAISKQTLQKIIKLAAKLPAETWIISCAYYDRVTGEYLSPRGVDLNKYFYSLSGANVFRREMFTKIGWLEDRFFLWGYEDDLVLRTLSAGKQIYFTVPKEIVIDHYSKENKMRPLKVFLSTRNKVWLLVKYFSWDVMFLLFLRDIIWILMQPYRYKSIKAFFYSVKGYLMGILTCGEWLKERKVAPREVQKRYLRTQFKVQQLADKLLSRSDQEFDIG